MKPKVSIIIPVYNGSNYLGEAIDSALAQKYPNIEIIVINDGSTDGGKTEEIALSYGDRIRYYYKPNGGVSSALNEGIRRMEGKYFSWLSHDDLYTPDKIGRQVELLEQCDERTICFCLRRQINAGSEVISGVNESDLNDGCVLQNREALIYYMGHVMNGCSMMIPKAAFDINGGFAENMRYCQDIHMWWRILISGYSMAFADVAGVFSRVHSEQLTNSNMDIYHSDALKIAYEVVPEFARLSDKNTNVLFAYAREEAIHANSETLKLCFAAADKNSLFSKQQKRELKSLLFYGRFVRPIIRKAYYFIKRTYCRSERRVRPC